MIILVVAAHADDEVLGCGGTIAKHVTCGDEVRVVCVADGVSSRPGTRDSEFEHRVAAANQAKDILGIASVEFLGFPDNRLDSVPLLDVVKAIEIKVDKYRPDIVYTHHSGDLNVDHRRTFEAVMTACRPLPESSISEIRTFEVVSSTGWAECAMPAFIPNVYVDISGFTQKKHSALRAYDLEMRQAPHSRSYENVECLARHRGMSVGIGAAEAFVQVRRIVK